MGRHGKGARYLEEKLRILEIDVNEIKDKPPLLAVKRVRRTFLQRFLESQRSVRGFEDLYSVDGSAVEVRDVDAAKKFIAHSLEMILPQGAEPRVRLHLLDLPGTSIQLSMMYKLGIQLLSI